MFLFMSYANRWICWCRFSPGPQFQSMARHRVPPSILGPCRSYFRHICMWQRPIGSWQGWLDEVYHPGMPVKHFHLLYRYIYREIHKLSRNRLMTYFQLFFVSLFRPQARFGCWMLSAKVANRMSHVLCSVCSCRRDLLFWRVKTSEMLPKTDVAIYQDRSTSKVFS